MEMTKKMALQLVQMRDVYLTPEGRRQLESIIKEQTPTTDKEVIKHV